MLSCSEPEDGFADGGVPGEVAGAAPMLVGPAPSTLDVGAAGASEVDNPEGRDRNPGIATPWPLSIPSHGFEDMFSPDW